MDEIKNAMIKSFTANHVCERFDNLVSDSDVLYVRHVPNYRGSTPAYISKIRNEMCAFVMPETSTILYSVFDCNNGHLVLKHVEGQLEKSLLSSRTDIIADLGKPPIELCSRIENPVIPLIYPGFKVYGHWLIDILPRIYLFNYLYPNTTFTLMLQNDTPAWAIQLIRAAFGDSFDICYAEPGMSYQAPLFIPRPTRYHDYISKTSILLSNACFKIKPSPNNLKNKIFVKRNQLINKSRILRNSKDVEALFLTFGFDTISPEEFTFEEQVSFFYNSCIVAGEAGSGLHNSIFMPNNTSVFNLNSSRQSHFIQAGLDYWGGRNVEYHFGKSDDDSWGSSYSINIELLASHLNDFLATHEVKQTPH